MNMDQREVFGDYINYFKTKIIYGNINYLDMLRDDIDLNHGLNNFNYCKYSNNIENNNL